MWCRKQLVWKFIKKFLYGKMVVVFHQTWIKQSSSIIAILTCEIFFFFLKKKSPGNRRPLNFTDFSALIIQTEVIWRQAAVSLVNHARECMI